MSTDAAGPPGRWPREGALPQTLTAAGAGPGAWRDTASGQSRPGARGVPGAGRGGPLLPHPQGGPPAGARAQRQARALLWDILGPTFIF